jgi:mono/diheme cytochrome c family protein
MLANILIWLAFVATAILFAWLVARAWRSKRWYIKWPGVLLSSLLSLLLLAVSAASLKGLVTLYWPHGDVVEISVSGTPEQIERGEYLANGFCAGCHSETGELPLTGGVDLAKDISLPIGSMISSNLTPAGRIREYSDGQIFRALRQGIDYQGRTLPTMSTVYARYLSDEDLKAMIAYLRSQPAVANNVPDPPTQFNFLGVLVTGLGLVEPLPEVTSEIIAPTKAVSAKYGEYVLSYQDCRVCHGQNLTGGTSQLAPYGPPLTGVKSWTQEEFLTAMRTGITPYGRPISDNIMPWRIIGRMDDTDLGALYLFITSREYTLAP